jgi:hypothetical protein
MATRIDARELLEVLRLTPAEQNVMLIGKHGIGKSEIISHYFSAERGMRVIPFFLGQMSDPGDLIGLMYKDEHSHRSLFMAPYWWPQDNEPVVLFLDELNRARPEILQSIQELALNKTLAGKKLPAGSVVISAVNEGDEYQLTDLDPALVSRFNLYEFAPSAEDWLVWASENNVDERVLVFIQKNSQFLDTVTATEEELMANAGLVKTPDRRAWVKVSDFVGPLGVLAEIHIKIISGMVGSTAAVAFHKSLKNTLLVTAEQVLLTFSRTKKKLESMSLKDLVTLNEQIVLWLNAGHCPEKKLGKARENLLAYMQFLQTIKQREAVAHLVSLLGNPKFEKAIAFAYQSMKIVELMTDYVEGIQVD